VKNFLDICNNWQDNQSYRLYGDIISKEGVAQFHMDDFIPVNWAKE
jgi:hypothetical protein